MSGNSILPVQFHTAVQTLAEYFRLTTLPNHVDQILLSATCYFVIFFIVSPQVSSICFPHFYNQLSRRTKINLNMRVVSFIQAVFICYSALQIVFYDSTRPLMSPQDRLWSYSPDSARVQSFAAGYFIWDLFVSIIYFDVFGLGDLAHATAALLITLLGFVGFVFQLSNTLLMYV